MGWRILVFYPEPEAEEHGLADISILMLFISSIHQRQANN
jgi:hypothetical protein